jgi:hypothetical protein
MSYSNIHHTDSDKRDPLAPQSLVVANGNVDPNLQTERQRNSSKKYPLYDPVADLMVRRGEWFFSRIDGNPRRNRHAQMNLDDIVGFTSASGMLGTEKFVFRGCVDYPGEQQSADGSATPRFGLSMRVVGNASGWHSGTAPIKQGDLVYADWPATKVDPHGIVYPHWQPDWNPTKFYFATHAMSPHSIAGAVTKFFRALAEAPNAALVHVVAKKAYEESTPFPGMTGDADPLKRFANFFAAGENAKWTMKKLREFESRVTRCSPADDEELSPEDTAIMQEYASNVLYSKELRDQGQTLDQIFSKTDIPTYSDEMGVAQFKSFQSGAVTFVSELEALKQARYMGVALANAQPGGPLDLLLH